MKLYHSAHSPYVRKVVIAATVLGLLDRIELIPARGNVMARDPEFRAVNPSGQIPVLVMDSGEALFDSPVICEYLDELAKGSFIGWGERRWRNLRDQALGDTMLDAALHVRYETSLRPEPLRWSDWQTAWSNKIVDTLALVERQVAGFGDRMDIGVVSIFCALAYIDARLCDVLPWRADFPQVAKWFDAFAEHPVVAPSKPV